MLSLLSLLLTSTLVAAAPHHHQLKHRHVSPGHGHAMSNAQSPAKRDTLVLGTETRMTDTAVEAIVHTCWNGDLPWPLASGVPMPVLDVVASQLDVFTVPESTANTLTVHNYCSYDLTYLYLDNSDTLESGTITAGSSISPSLSGTVMKVGKDSTLANPVQIEVGGGFYDVSLINCLGSTDGVPNADTSACAGHEAGLQLSNPGSMAFQCGSGVWCDDQAYLYQENLCKAENPVTMGDFTKGLTMEFCASMKP